METLWVRKRRTAVTAVLALIAIGSLMLWVPAVSVRLGCASRASKLSREGRLGGLSVAEASRQCYASLRGIEGSGSSGALGQGGRLSMAEAYGKRASAAEAAEAARVASPHPTLISSLRRTAVKVRAAALRATSFGMFGWSRGGRAFSGVADPALSVDPVVAFLRDAVSLNLPPVTSCEFCDRCLLNDGTWAEAGVLGGVDGAGRAGAEEARAVSEALLRAGPETRAAGRSGAVSGAAGARNRARLDLLSRLWSGMRVGVDSMRSVLEAREEGAEIGEEAFVPVAAGAEEASSGAASGSPAAGGAVAAGSGSGGGLWSLIRSVVDGAQDAFLGSSLDLTPEAGADRVAEKGVAETAGADKAGTLVQRAGEGPGETGGKGGTVVGTAGQAGSAAVVSSASSSAVATNSSAASSTAAPSLGRRLREEPVADLDAVGAALAASSTGRSPAVGSSRSLRAARRLLSLTSAAFASSLSSSSPSSAGRSLSGWRPTSAYVASPRSNCSLCGGCTTRLYPMALELTFDGRRLTMPYTGASPSWTVLVSSARIPSGRFLRTPPDRIADDVPVPTGDAQDLRRANESLPAPLYLHAPLGERGEAPADDGEGDEWGAAATLTNAKKTKKTKRAKKTKSEDENDRVDRPLFLSAASSAAQGAISAAPAFVPYGDAEFEALLSEVRATLDAERAALDEGGQPMLVESNADPQQKKSTDGPGKKRKRSLAVNAGGGEELGKQPEEKPNEQPNEQPPSSSSSLAAFLSQLARETALSMSSSSVSVSASAVAASPALAAVAARLATLGDLETRSAADILLLSLEAAVYGATGYDQSADRLIAFAVPDAGARQRERERADAEAREEIRRRRDANAAVERARKESANATAAAATGEGGRRRASEGNAETGAAASAVKTSRSAKRRFQGRGAVARRGAAMGPGADESDGGEASRAGPSFAPVGATFVHVNRTVVRNSVNGMTSSKKTTSKTSANGVAPRGLRSLRAENETAASSASSASGSAAPLLASSASSLPSSSSSSPRRSARRVASLFSLLPPSPFSARAPAGPFKNAVAKLLCTSVTRQGKPGRPCGAKTLRKARTLEALDALAGACGVRGSVVAPFWMERLRAPLPGVGATFDGLAYLTARAEGIPGNILAKTHRRSREAMDRLNVALGAIPREHVLGAAVYDYLIGQCDRHPDNVFISDAGRLTLIDNDQALGDAWRTCSHDSVFLPTTEKFDIAAYGFAFVTKKDAEVLARDGPDALVALDPRCHAEPREPGRSIADPETLERRAARARATNLTIEELPEGAQTCVSALAAETGVAYAASTLGFTLSQAREVAQRARDLAKLGLVGALQRGAKQNPATLTRPLHEPCCAIRMYKKPTDRDDEEGGGNAAGAKQAKAPPEQRVLDDGTIAVKLKEGNVIPLDVDGTVLNATITTLANGTTVGIAQSLTGGVLVVSLTPETLAPFANQIDETEAKFPRFVCAHEWNPIVAYNKAKLWQRETETVEHNEKP